MLGTDYEFFAISDKFGSLISSDRFGLGGKRDEHEQIVDDAGNKCGYIHKDNVMVEVCTLPATTGKEFNAAIERSLAAAQQFIAGRVPRSAIGQHAAQNLPQKLLASLPEASEIGCDVDFTIDIGYNSVPRTPLNSNLLGNSRYAGGHVHVSYDNPSLSPGEVASLFDLLVAIPCARYLTKDRAPWYGLSGLHRPTKYPDGSSGVEYRVLDNVWIHSQHLRNYVCNMADIIQQLTNPLHYDLREHLLDAPFYKQITMPAFTSSITQDHLQKYTMDALTAGLKGVVIPVLKGGKSNGNNLIVEDEEPIIGVDTPEIQPDEGTTFFARATAALDRSIAEREELARRTMRATGTRGMVAGRPRPFTVWEDGHGISGIRATTADPTPVRPDRVPAWFTTEVFDRAVAADANEGDDNA